MVMYRQRYFRRRAHVLVVRTVRPSVPRARVSIRQATINRKSASTKIAAMVKAAAFPSASTMPRMRDTAAISAAHTTRRTTDAWYPVAAGRWSLTCIALTYIAPDLYSLDLYSP